jgi:hypothetical protein
MKYEQVEITSWPSCDARPIAVLRLEPEELGARLHLLFSDGEDDLDRLKQAGLRLFDGEQILLVRYLRAPTPGTDVYGDAGANAAELLERFLAATGLRRADVAWQPVTTPRRAKHA